MVTSQYSSQVDGRAIYPTSGYMPYLVVLVAGKFVRSFGLFLSYDVLKVIHLIQFLCAVKGIGSIILIPAQKPFTAGPPLSQKLWLKIAWHSLCGTIVHLLWLFGLTLCGPLRTVLLFEHSEIVITAAGSVLLFGGSGGPSKLRGAVFILIAVISLLLFDNDDVVANVQRHSQEGHAGFDADHEQHSSIISHIFYHITSWFGLSDHKGGVCLLFITLGIKCWHENNAKKLAPVIGGLKRLYAISTIISFIILIPWALMVFMGIQVPKQSVMSMFFPILLITVFVFLIDHYVETTAVAKVNQFIIVRYGTMSIFIIALILSCFWSEAYKAQVTIHDHIQEIMAEEHMLSGGVIFSIIMLLFATHILTSPTKGVRGSFIGYSPSGLPLYNITGDALQRTSQSVATVLKNGLKQILEESDSRKIFYFLCVNIMFTFVELVYGVWTNSLGLISDGFHMLFDCSALVLGLYAAIMTRWKATRIFSFGYDRVEVLSGFINGLFLTVIAVFVFTAAIGRLFDPPEISTERLLTVSVAGLVVNLIGMTAFSHVHSHGGQSCHAHGSTQSSTGSSTGGHGHSHSSGGHGHSHGSGGHGHNSASSHGHSPAPQQHGNIRGSTNMKGVFLHVLADTLGSVGVIVSSILIENFGWNIADPICSLFIAIMIFLSVIPLLQETAYILLLRTPADMQKELDYGLEKVLALEGVTSYGEQHFWQHASDKFCGTLHIQIREESAEQKIIQQVATIFKELGVTQMTVQVEKNAFYEHMSGLGTDMQTMSMMTKNYRTPISFRHKADFIKSV